MPIFLAVCAKLRHYPFAPKAEAVMALSAGANARRAMEARPSGHRRALRISFPGLQRFNVQMCPIRPIMMAARRFRENKWLHIHRRGAAKP